MGYVTSLIVMLGAAPVVQEDGQWTMPAKDYAASRYSGLTGINTANVKRLRAAWSFSTFTT